MTQNNYIMTTESDVLYDPARYTGIDQVVVDNDNDTIGISASFISTVNNKLDSSTFTSYTAAHASDDITPYTAGSNINITNHVVSGKDWSSDISNAVAPKLDTTTYNTYTAAHATDDVTPYTAGANINITNHVVSGRDWSSEIGAKLDTSTYNTYVAAHASDDNTPYSAGSNINIANHVISGKDWSSDISNAVSPKLDASVFNSYSAAHASDDNTPYSGGTGITVNNHQISCNGDITPYSAGANISIANHVVSGRDWSSDISNATSGKIDKVTGGAGSETNPVYLNSSNVITPCFSNTNSVKLSPDNPSYFSGDAGGNVMLRGAYQSTHLSNYSIKNSVILGWQTNYQRSSSSKEHFDNCVLMNGYMYGYGTTPALSYNTIIGYNSIANAEDRSDNNTIIGALNDFVDYAGSGLKYYNNTFIGYQNNTYTDTHACTVIGANNDIGNGAGTNNKDVYDVTIIGNANDYKYDATNSSPYYGVIVGDNNKVTSRQNYKTMAIGFDNSLSGNCTYLIGDGLTAADEGSYSNKVMKLGMDNTFLKVESSGAIKQVINGTANEIQNKLTGITDVQVVTAMPASPVANVLYLVKE